MCFERIPRFCKFLHASAPQQRKIPHSFNSKKLYSFPSTRAPRCVPIPETKTTVFSLGLSVLEKGSQLQLRCLKGGDTITHWQSSLNFSHLEALKTWHSTRKKDCR